MSGVQVRVYHRNVKKVYINGAYRDEESFMRTKRVLIVSAAQYDILRSGREIIHRYVEQQKIPDINYEATSAEDVADVKMTTVRLKPVFEAVYKYGENDPFVGVYEAENL